jgi:hypothetical protein
MPIDPDESTGRIISLAKSGSGTESKGLEDTHG